jgi:hypothetical protein
MADHSDLRVTVKILDIIHRPLSLFETRRLRDNDG